MLSLLFLVPGQRELDHGTQVLRPKWLSEKSVLSRFLDFFDRCRIAIRGQIDYGSLEPLPDELRRLRSLHCSSKHDIHQNQIRSSLFDKLDGLLACRSKIGHFVPQRCEPAL